ncbi:uncharacterized protein PHACADRAFT_102456, partial [Phanerochaete carnosa HHB-10118-sp]
MSGPLERAVQDQVWQLPSSATEHVPGILRLCVGMPVMLKHSEATELCAMNGAEGTVYSWDAHEGAEGRLHIDTLFVKLVNPPRHVCLPNLPEDVIPIGSVAEKLECVLPNDSKISIYRQQVHVLQNFAKSDFGSQGRTRPFNLCHLRNCRNQQSMYTCLSRSSSLAGILILDDFDEMKVRGGINGPLCQEF